MEIGFIGLGKLGLDCAEVFAQHYKVRGYDVAPRHSKTVVICSLEETVANSDWIFVAVPTPHAEGYDGSVPSSHMEPRDFSYDMVDAVIESVNQHATTTKRVVLISTVLPGTTRHRFRTQLHEQHRLIYNPYLIAMGSVKWDMVNPEMVIIGSDNEGDIQDLIDIYGPLMQNDPRYVTGTWDECEAIKIFYNTFISAKVGLANMIQDFAVRIGNINVDVVTEALAQSTMRIMGPKYMTAGMGDAGACHPRDNIALRWLARKHDIGYDLFDTIMQAREHQARNLAQFLVDLTDNAAAEIARTIVIHGKAYKPDVPYCIGSYSTLVGFYVKQLGRAVHYLDPLADDPADVIDQVDEPCVLLMAHNRAVSYGYTGDLRDDMFYCDIPQGSIIVDPWRRVQARDQYQVVHYGNTNAGGRHF